MRIDTKYDLGELVYLKTDPDQNARMIVCINISPNGTSYTLGFNGTESYHYECEFNKEKDILKSLD